MYVRRSPELDILQLGDPRLRRVAEPVADLNLPAVVTDGRRLYRALQAFRLEHGFGRAIAAPQIDIVRRMIALHLRAWPSIIINPVIVWRSAESFTLWDDCMSFPFMLVRVSRAVSISVRFLDAAGREYLRERLDAATSELLQHEIDHLDGVLAVDRVIGKEPLVSRKIFERQREHFLLQVDHRP